MVEQPQRPILVRGESLRGPVELVSGGGEKYRPESFENARKALAPQMTALRSAIDTMPTELRADHVIFEATLWANFVAASYHPRALLNRVGLDTVGTRTAKGVLRTAKRIVNDQPTKTLLLAGTPQQIADFDRLLKRHADSLPTAITNDIAEISGLGLSPVERVVRALPESAGAGELITWEAVLHRAPGGDNGVAQKIQDQIFEKLIAYVRKLSGDVRPDFRRIVQGVTFVPIALPVEAIYELARFNPLRTLRPMPKLRPISTGVLRAIGDASAPPLPAHPGPLRTDERVAVFDGGIDPDCPYLRPFTRHFDATEAAPEPQGIYHGSLVTSTVLFGAYREGEPLRQPPFAVDHHRVLPVPADEEWDLELNHVLDSIVRTVEEHDYKFVNLSLGPNYSINDDDEPHRWTAELDRLAHERGVTFVAAVGNNGELDSTLGLNRVQVPGDMVNGITVGACISGEKGKPYERASYSAVGPGRWGARVSPTGLCFGGDEREAFVGIGHRGRITATAGTSLAAPLALHGLANLGVNLGIDRIRPEVMRACAVHFSEPLRGKAHDLTAHGFGRLRQDYGNILDLVPNAVTLLYEDEIHRDEEVGLLLPYVTGLIDPDQKVEITYTLCFASPIDIADSADYTSAGCEIFFRPHSRIFNFSPPETEKGAKSPPLHVDEDAAAVEALTRRGWTPSANPAPLSRGRRAHSEQGRREFGKWETVIHHSFGTHARSLHEPRLDVTYLARRGGNLVPDAEPLRYTMLVSIRAPQGVPFYQAVRQQFNTLVPLASQVQLRTE